MSSYKYFEDLNILGKVDSNKTIIAPEAFHFKLKETQFLSQYDYDRLKTVLDTKQLALEPSKEWIEEEKNKRFQSLFENLWPNLYKNATETALEKEAALKAKSEAEKNKTILNFLLQQDSKNKNLATSTSSMTYTNDNFLSSTKNNNINIAIGGLNTNSPKIEITTPNFSNTTPMSSGTSHSFSSNTLSSTTYKYPGHVSGYDIPLSSTKNLNEFGNLDSYYLSNEAKLLKEIQESQEKLKMAQKLEKTTDLVDDIITKVSVLQTEMKKRSASIKLQEEINKINKEKDHLKYLRSSLASSINSNDDHYHHRHHHSHFHHSDHTHNSRSCHHSRSKSTENKSRRSSRSSSRESKHRSTTPIIVVSKEYPARSRSILKKSASKARLSHNVVLPKVNSWNLNCRHDENIY